LDFDDNSPWPAAPDDNGVSLVLRNAESVPNHSLPQSWGAHTTVGGGPGVADTIAESGLAIWKVANGVTSDDEDADLDGLAALVEYALGTSPNVPNYNALVPGSVDFEGADYLTLQFDQNVDATDVDFQIQSSTELEAWVDEDVVEVFPGVYRLSTPITGEPRHFLRLKISVR
jgi:hypothetical protein